MHKTALVHGRFQPPHSGHIRFIQEAFNRADHVIIGICTPKICTDQEAERTGYPCAPHMNPFTHSERINMITLALSEAGIQKSRYSFIPFPSDYKNIESVVPKDCTFFISHTGKEDEAKIKHLEKLGLEVKTIYTLQENSKSESGSAIRLKQGKWQDMVPRIVLEYMENNNMLK